MQRFYLLFVALFFLASTQAQEANYDESLVPDFVLPPLFQLGNEKPTIDHWENERRPQLLKMLQNEMFGTGPSDLKTSFILNKVERVFDGEAIRKEVTLQISNGKATHDIGLLIYLPSGKSSAPIFLGLNFYGNHTIHTDPGISIHHSWVANKEEFGIHANRATEESRGVRVHRWPVEMILKAGYGLATIYYGDIDPDFDDGFENGVHALVDQEDKVNTTSLATWAWGMSRALDYFEQDPSVDGEKVIAIGHSRLGKAALWAGASDQRFAMVVSNDSGCGGAALSRRRFGETVARINTVFPHWFSPNFKKYNDKEEDLPFDQHTLAAMIAPRPLYIASAEEDQWADPKGEFLSGYYASEVYELYDLTGMATDEQPAINTPNIEGKIGYHIRTGGHDLAQYDWEQFIAFADKHLKE